MLQDPTLLCVLHNTNPHLHAVCLVCLLIIGVPTEMPGLAAVCSPPRTLRLCYLWEG